MYKIINYLYPNGFDFGLKRKFDKAMNILNVFQSNVIV